MIYLDSCIAIYLVEQRDPYLSQIDSALAATRLPLCSSELVKMECLVRPIRDNNMTLITAYEATIQGLNRLDISPAVFGLATKIRAQFRRLKTPDALHLACAKHHGCTEFWTHDERLNAAALALGLKTIVFN